MERDGVDKFDGPDLASLPDFYTQVRVHPETGEVVPGRYLWTPESPDAPSFPEVSVCNPQATEQIPPLPLERDDDQPLPAVGLLVEPSLDDARKMEGEPGLMGLRNVCDRYTHSCTCRTAYANNCAHYLSNAFILAGYSDLLTSPIITARCPHRRPIRAQDMLRWFQAKQSGYHGARIQRNTGIWATYQETPGSQHVVVIDTDRWLYYGTGDYHTWRVQWNYRIR